MIDGDLGMANAHVLLGIQPKKNLFHLFSEGISLKEILVETHSGLVFMSGGSGLFDFAKR